VSCCNRVFKTGQAAAELFFDFQMVSANELARKYKGEKE